MLFEKNIYFPLKKTGPGQTRAHDLCHPSHISYLQVQLAGNA